MNTPKVSLMIALFLAALALGTMAAIEVALLSQSVQDVDARECSPGGVPYNASQGRCFK
jgi:sensor domain CHASE-containing protein